MVSEVAEFFRDKSVFVTGGTGFLGIAVVEKLLRCCPDIKNIYLLIRPKKGKKAQERLQDVTKNSVSDDWNFLLLDWLMGCKTSCLIIWFLSWLKKSINIL